MNNEQLRNLDGFFLEVLTNYSVFVNSLTGNDDIFQDSDPLYKVDNDVIVSFLPLLGHHYEYLVTEFKNSFNPDKLDQKVAQGLFHVINNLEIYTGNEGFDKFVDSQKDTINKHFPLEMDVSICLPLYILANYFQVYGQDTPEYLNHYIGDKTKKAKKSQISFATTGSGNRTEFYMRIQTSRELFYEYFIFYFIKFLPTETKWVKSPGSIPCLGWIYKHHKIVFNNWISVELDANDRVKLGFYNKHDDELQVETNLKSGTQPETVFTRCISRYYFTKEQPYLLLRNNCEHFGRYAFYGSPRSNQALRFFMAFGFIFFVNSFLGWPVIKYSLLGILTVVILFELFCFYLWRKHNQKSDFKRTLQVICCNPFERCWILLKEYLMTYTYFPR